MKKNIGTVKAFLSESLKKDYTVEQINEAKSNAKKFYEIIKESNILTTQFNVYKNIEGKHIDDDFLATRYIDENISLFEKYGKDEIINENTKLDEFTIDGFESEKKDLYEAIDALILQAPKDRDFVDVDHIHEAFVTVFDYIKNNKKEVVTESEILDFDYPHITTEQVIGLALEKFNEKYSGLDESEKKLLQVLTLGTREDKVEQFVSLKTDNLQLLESMDKNGIADKITETIDRIEKMGNGDDILATNTISLFELKKSLS